MSIDICDVRKGGNAAPAVTQAITGTKQGALLIGHGKPDEFAGLKWMHLSPIAPRVESVWFHACHTGQGLVPQLAGHWKKRAVGFETVVAYPKAKKSFVVYQGKIEEAYRASVQAGTPLSADFLKRELTEAVKGLSKTAEWIDAATSLSHVVMNLEVY